MPERDATPTTGLPPSPSLGITPFDEIPPFDGSTTFDHPAASEIADTASVTTAEAFTRRRFVKGTTALTIGLAASAYVKPGLRHLGVPGALAQVSGSPQPPDPPAPNLCRPGFGNVGGICVPCPPNHENVGDVCVPNLDGCPDHYERVNGVCVPNLNGCQDGFQNVGGVCVPNPP
jgi:hypothetical protein